MIQLYHYPHCPFCQRIRLFLGFKGVPYESVVLSYSDTETPKKLGYPKMLPIIVFEDGISMNDSIPILREIENRLPHPIGFIGPVESNLQWASIAAVGIPQYFDLLLPWFADHYQEFVDFPEGKKYFQNCKESKRGKTFKVLKENRKTLFTQNILPHLEPIIEKVENEYFVMGPTFSVADCVLAADLSGLRIIPDLAIPPEITHYIERVEKHCRVKLLENQKI